MKSGLGSVPANPLELLNSWFADAERESGMVNHHSMTLATVGVDGRPSVRVVLRKGFDVETGRLAFFTNYESRKAREVDANPDVAICMHWDGMERQVRVEGLAERVSADESDAYFATRPRTHQLGAWASDQSRPLKGPKTLMARVLVVAGRFVGRPIERPPHWGGYEVMPTLLEFWQAGEGRIHQRLQYTRVTGGTVWTPQWIYP